MTFLWEGQHCNRRFNKPLVTNLIEYFGGVGLQILSDLFALAAQTFSGL